MAHTFEKTRLEAFSDGVIAVIITIMVLELKVPHGDTWSGPDGLHTLVPTFVVYAVSFLFVGTYWINHHYLLHRIDRTDTRVLWTNIAFLFLLSLIPFFTNYMEEKHLNSLSLVLYAVVNLLVGFGFNILRSAVHRRLRKQGVIDCSDVAAERKHWGSLAIYALAIFVAFHYTYVALFLLAAVMLLWVNPTLGTTNAGTTNARTPEQRELSPMDPKD